jgi:hypothetical protein
MEGETVERRADDGVLNAGRPHDAQLRCGPGEVQRFTDGHEVPQMPQFHFSTPSCLKSIVVQAMQYWAKQTNARKVLHVVREKNENETEQK